MILRLNIQPHSRRARETLAWQGFSVLVAWQLVGNWAAGLLALYWQVRPPRIKEVGERRVALDLLALKGGWMTTHHVMVKDRSGTRVSVYRDEVSSAQFAELRRAVKQSQYPDVDPAEP